MARVTGPLMSLDASGSIGKAITFAKWRGRNYVRRLVVPSNPKSALQVAMRASLRFITQSWAALSVANQNQWADLAATDNITLMNASVRMNQQRNRQGDGVVSYPTVAAGTTPDAPTDDGSVAGFKEADLAWAAGADAPQWCWYIWRSTTASFTRGPSTLIRIVPAADLTFIDVGLESGVDYYYEIAGGNFNGEIGASSTEINIQPT